MIRIALVDDHSLFRMGLKAILSDYQDLLLASEAENGKKFIESLADHPVDVVLMDLEMPVMDGVEATEYLKAHHPEVRVIMLTMHDDDGFMLKLMEIGASGYLLKNTGQKELVAAIRTSHETGVYFNDRLSMAMLKNIGKKQAAFQKPGQPHDLTEREVEVLKLICDELTTPEIAEKLFLSPRTVETYRKTLFEKTGVKNMAGLVMWAVRNGLVD
jgi:DNA-binding NarL/FixJ family response regulator